MTQEKIHGGVQFGINFDYDQHPNIPYHSDAVDAHKSQEEWYLQFWVIWEAWEGEHGSTFVFLWH